MENFSAEEIELFRQWFNSTQDMNPAYLERRDYALAKRLYESLEMRVPHSILRELGIKTFE